MALTAPNALAITWRVPDSYGISSVLVNLYADPPGLIVIKDNRILHRSFNGQETLLAGDDEGFSDGVGASAKFSRPRGMAFDADGKLLITDTFNHCIRELDIRTKTVKTLTGDTSTGIPGFADGPADHAEFNWPTALVIDSEGRVIVADTENNLIRRLDRKTGQVTTIAGDSNRENPNGPFSGFADGPALRAHFKSPGGLAFDRQGNLLIADTGNHRIRSLNFETQQVTTVAGAPSAGNNFGRRDGPAQQAQFEWPTSLILDHDGAVLIADNGNHVIRRLNLQTKQVTTVANSVGSSNNGKYVSPNRLALWPTGGVFVAYDAWSGQVLNSLTFLGPNDQLERDLVRLASWPNAKLETPKPRYGDPADSQTESRELEPTAQERPAEIKALEASLVSRFGLPGDSRLDLPDDESIELTQQPASAEVAQYAINQLRLELARWRVYKPRRAKFTKPKADKSTQNQSRPRDTDWNPFTE